MAESWCSFLSEAIKNFLKDYSKQSDYVSNPSENSTGDCAGRLSYFLSGGGRISGMDTSPQDKASSYYKGAPGSDTI